MNMLNVNEQISVVVEEKIRQFIGKQINTQFQIKVQLQVAAQVFSALLKLVNTNIILVKQNYKL